MSGTGAEKASLVTTLTEQVLDLLTAPRENVADRVIVQGEFVGPGYGLPTDEMLEAVEMVARLEGLLLDPVYTGKAMAGLIHAIRNGEFTPGQNVLFWHTGGAVALFAYRDVFEAYLGREKKHPRNR